MKNPLPLVLMLLVGVLCAVMFFSTRHAETINQPATIESAPQADANDPNPYKFEAIPPRVTSPDDEQPIPTVTASNDGYDVIRKSFVSVEMHNFAGSGVIVRPGIVVTNAHVVYDEDGDLRSRSIRVRLTDGSSKRATVIGYSATYDVAVLSIDDNFGTPAQLATEDAYVGQRILAVGNPPSGARQVYGNVLELDLPVMHRYVPDRTNQPVNMFVVTNRVVHGYSGGPMVDASTGVVYGITVGQVQYYNDPETGERKRVRPYAGAAMHISDVMAEVDRILADNDA